MTSQTLLRQRRQREGWEAITREKGQFGAVPDSSFDVRNWGCPSANSVLRPILDRTVGLVINAAAQAEPGWIAEIGCHGGLWTEWIALTMKSCHTEPGAPRLKLAVVDQSPSTMHSTVEYLRMQCLPTPESMKICHDGEFTLDGAADVIFSFDTLVRFDLDLIRAYCESVARVLRPGGKFLVSLPCRIDRVLDGKETSEEIAEPAVVWTVQGLTFAAEVRETFERNFSYSLDEVTPIAVGPGQVFFEFTRQRLPE